MLFRHARLEANFEGLWTLYAHDATFESSFLALLVLALLDFQEELLAIDGTLLRCTYHFCCDSRTHGAILEDYEIRLLSSVDDDILISTLKRALSLPTQAAQIDDALRGWRGRVRIFSSYFP